MSRNFKIGEMAPEFDLPGVDGKNHSLKEFDERKVVVVMFTCNHCPYVQAYENRLMAIQRDYAEKGVALVAINANDIGGYPEDSFEHMVTRSKNKGYNFPYLRDETQKIATAYGAQYTPEIFVLDKERRLRYHGRIDENWKEPDRAKSHDLRNAIEVLLEGREPKPPETQAFGCTIKWSQ